MVTVSVPIKKVDFKIWRNRCDMSEPDNKCGDPDNSRCNHQCISRNCDSFKRLESVE